VAGYRFAFRWQERVDLKARTRRVTSAQTRRVGVHGGSRSVRKFIDSAQPDYFFCGHIHEGEGREIRIGKTVARNVGKRGYLLEL